MPTLLSLLGGSPGGPPPGVTSAAQPGRGLSLRLKQGFFPMRNCLLRQLLFGKIKVVADAKQLVMNNVFVFLVECCGSFLMFFSRNWVGPSGDFLVGRQSLQFTVN